MRKMERALRPATLRRSCLGSCRSVRAGVPAEVLLLPLSQWWAVLLLGILLIPAAGGASGHVVTQMRGFDGPLPFHIETGYVEVDEQQGMQLFYYFVRSENGGPVLLWLSGGPGCSGISGLAYEIGPVQFDAQGYRGGFPTLLYRPEAWTKALQERSIRVDHELR